MYEQDVDDYIADMGIEELAHLQEKKKKRINLLALCRRTPECMKPWVVDDLDKNLFVSCDLCLAHEVEYLTPEGWVKVLDLKEGQEVWQVDKDTLQGSFVQPSRIIKRRYTGDLITYKSRRGSIRVTEGHTMLHIGQQTHSRADKRKWRSTFLAGDTPSSKGGNIACFSYSSMFDNNELYDAEDIWKACALQADGYFDTTYQVYNIEVRKPRKIEKLSKLFGTRKPKLRKDVEKYSTRWNYLKFDHPLLTGKRLNVEKLHPSQIPIFLEALEFFDGCPSHKTKNGRITWGSSDKEQVDAIQMFLTRNGYECRATVQTFDTPAWKDTYKLSIKRLGTIRAYDAKNGKWLEEVRESYDGMVGCVTVDTGFIMVRCNGQVFVVGNCGAEPMVQLNVSDDKMLRYFLFDGKGVAPYWEEVNGVPTLMTTSQYITFASRNPLGRDVLIEAWNKDWGGKTFAEKWLEPEGADEIKKWLDKDKGDKYRLFKMCVAKGTLIHTDKGIKKIEEITVSDRVWNGVKYVKHNGIVEKRSKTTKIGGINATKTHRVFTTRGFRKVEEIKNNKEIKILQANPTWKEVWQLFCYLCGSLYKR